MISSIARPRVRPFLLGSGLLLVGGLASAASLETTITDANGAALEHAVVSLHAGEPRHAPPGTGAVIDQRERRFDPSVIAVQAGTGVAFPNSDDVRHHVYSFSSAKTFQLKLYHGEPSEPVRFDEPGIVTLGCNIHDGMLGYVAVVATPLFATSGADGRATVEDVAPGTYTLELWHPDLGLESLRREVEIGSGVARMTIRLGGELTGRLSIGAAHPLDDEAGKSPLQSLFDD